MPESDPVAFIYLKLIPIPIFFWNLLADDLTAPFFFVNARADDVLLFEELPEDRLEGAPSRMQGVDLRADGLVFYVTGRS